MASRLWQVLQSWVMTWPSVRLVVTVVATEATRKIRVAQVVGIRPPGDVHGREDVAIVNVHQSFGGLLDLGALAVVNGEIVLAVVRAAGFRGFPSRLPAGWHNSRLSRPTETLCTKGSDGLMRPAAISVSTASSGRWKVWLGRSWQSMQSIRRRSPCASSSGLGGVSVEANCVKVPSGFRCSTQGITCRFVSEAM